MQRYDHRDDTLLTMVDLYDMVLRIFMNVILAWSTQLGCTPSEVLTNEL